MDGIDDSFDESMLPCPSPLRLRSLSLFRRYIITNAVKKNINHIVPQRVRHCFNTIYKTVKKDEETLVGPLKLVNKYMYQLYDTEPLGVDLTQGFTISISFDITGVDLRKYNDKEKKLQFYHLGLLETKYIL